jgi:hypothetical protein
MIDDLKLDGVPLKVYALIYSFTRVGSNFHGSIDYICQRTGASYKAVHSALKLLVKKGYITKTETKPRCPSIYVAITDVKNQDYICNENKLHMTYVESTDNNKDNNKPYNYTNNHLYFNGKPRPIQAFGSKKVVMMTLHEYANLLRAVGVKPTLRYVRLLENRITANRFPVKDNHYEMIIEWAREDRLVTPEGEEILRN